MLERLGRMTVDLGPPSRIVADARKAYSGPVWALEKGVLRVAGAAATWRGADESAPTRFY
jgi:hypothetical protein